MLGMRHFLVPTFAHIADVKLDQRERQLLGRKLTDRNFLNNVRLCLGSKAKKAAGLGIEVIDEAGWAEIVKAAG